MNLLKDRDGVNRMAGRGWQGVGLGLVILTALAGTVLAQGGGQGGGFGQPQPRMQAGPQPGDAGRAASSAGDSTADRRDSGKPVRAAARNGG